jgi:hypothetical protein
MFSKYTWGSRSYKTNPAGLGASSLAKKMAKAAKAEEGALEARAKA